jgi:hypothetical protein
MDVDLYRRGGDLDEAENALRNTAELDLGGYFRFTLTRVDASFRCAELR